MMADVLPIPPAGPTAAATTCVRAALEYTLDGDLRFLSHHDELRWLLRALVRAAWPLAYSHGYNPKPRVVIPLPRSVGCVARSQVALVDLARLAHPQDLHDTLARQMPRTCVLHSVAIPASRKTPHAQVVAYELPIDAGDRARLPARVADLLARESAIVQRTFGPRRPAEPIDIRPYINSLELDGLVLRMELAFREQRTARPSEVITKLGLARDAYEHRLRRVHVQWDLELSGPSSRPVAHERKTLDYEEDNESERTQDHP